MNKLIRIWRAGEVTRVEEDCIQSFGWTLSKEIIRRPRYRWEGNIKMDLIEVDWKVWTRSLWINCEGCGRERPQSNLRDYIEIFQEGLVKTTHISGPSLSKPNSSSSSDDEKVITVNIHKRNIIIFHIWRYWNGGHIFNTVFAGRIRLSTELTHTRNTSVCNYPSHFVAENLF
jgi:hypothetical protein